MGATFNGIYYVVMLSKHSVMNSKLKDFYEAFKLDALGFKTKHIS